MRRDPGSVLASISQLNQTLEQHFHGKLIVEPLLTRSLVSFQANKTRPVYRWYKYKEAFSASLVEYLLQKYRISELDRIGEAFARSNITPHTFFVGAAIEKKMATEIWGQLESGRLSNAANLTNEQQIASLTLWLCGL